MTLEQSLIQKFYQLLSQIITFDNDDTVADLKQICSMSILALEEGNVLSLEDAYGILARTTDRVDVYLVNFYEHHKRERFKH